MPELRLVENQPFEAVTKRLPKNSAMSQFVRKRVRVTDSRSYVQEVTVTSHRKEVGFQAFSWDKN